jgi:hypothetical protein
MPSSFPADWFVMFKADGIDRSKPLLYEWSIESVGFYIGQTIQVTRRIVEYEQNLQNFLAGRPYRKNNRDGFRCIHRALAKAIEEDKKIYFTLLENESDTFTRNRRKRELIVERAELPGRTGLQSLNSSRKTA